MDLQKIRQDQFPRADALPTQSPQFWVKEKDRYLRQLLIDDIQARTNRDLVVYFDASNSGIDFQDAEDISEVLDGCQIPHVDIMIKTPGGDVDACEKLIKLLQKRKPGYRTIVPNFAKSGGTLIAISSAEIVMGPNSDLGPLDPQFGDIPAEIVSGDPEVSHSIRMSAENAISRTKKLAEELLSKGQFRSKQEDISGLVDQLISVKSYMSHGAVIDADEAMRLGLNVKLLGSTDDLWKQIWLLYCMYRFDCDVFQYAKVFEGPKFSLARPLVRKNDEAD